MEEVTRQCDQCHQEKPLSQFMDGWRKLRQGFVVSKCDDCAQRNMRVWSGAEEGEIV